MAVAMIGPKFYAWDRNGKPLAFGKLYTYQARTNAPKPTYQSEDQVVENTNPVILNGEGYANIYLDGSYKMVLKDDNDNEIWSSDPVSSAQPNEWVNCLTASYVNPTTLKVNGNFTNEYDPERKVRIDNGTTEYSYSTVVESTFAAGETTIIIQDAVVTTGVDEICASIVGKESSLSKKDISLITDYVFKNVEDLKSGTTTGGDVVSLSIGMAVKTLGYYEPSDGGGATYEIVASGTGTDDGGSYISTPETQAKLLFNEEINIRQFGAIGDGTTDDNDKITKSLEYARDRGGYNTVIVPTSPTDQEYIFTQLKVYSKTTFKGAGGVLKIKDNTVVDIGLSYYPINNLGEDRVIYDGLIVEGNSSNNPAPVVCDTITCTGFRSKVINCVLFNAIDTGIMFSGATRAFCKNNYIEGARDLCIYVNAGDLEGLGESIVSNNICKNAPFGGIGIKRFSANCIVEANTIVDCGNGITVEDFGGGSNPTNLHIVNNNMRRIGFPLRGANVAERGISISRASNLIVSGNKIYECSGDCILASNLDDSIISNNHVTGYISSPSASGNNGIIASTTPVNNIIVSGNIVKGVATRGIYFGDPTECQIINNQVESVSSALRINAPGNECVVTGNVLFGTGGLDTELFSGAVVIFKDNILKNGATELSKYGIRTISSGQPFPDVSGFIARFPGEELVHLADTSWWKSYGTGAGEWKRMTT